MQYSSLTKSSRFIGAPGPGIAQTTDEGALSLVCSHEDRAVLFWKKAHLYAATRLTMGHNTFPKGFLYQVGPRIVSVHFHGGETAKCNAATESSPPVAWTCPCKGDISRAGTWGPHPVGFIPGSWEGTRFRELQS